MKTLKIFLLLLFSLFATSVQAGFITSIDPNPEKEQKKRFEKTLDSLYKVNNRVWEQYHVLMKAREAKSHQMFDVSEDSLNHLFALATSRQQLLDSLRGWSDIFETNDRITGESFYDSLRRIEASDTASIRVLLRQIGLYKDLTSPGRPDTPQLEWLDSTFALWAFCKEKGFNTRQGRMDIRLEYVLRYGRPNSITWSDGDCTQIIEKEHVQYCIIYHWNWLGNIKPRDFEAKADGLEVSVRPTEEEKFATNDAKEIHFNLQNEISRIRARDTLIALNLAQGDTILGRGAITVATSVLPKCTSNDSVSLVISAFGINLDSLAVDSLGKKQFHVELLVRNDRQEVVDSFVSKSWRVPNVPNTTIPVACTTTVKKGIWHFTHTVRDENGKRFGFIASEVFAPSPYVSKGSGEMVKIFSPHDPVGGASQVQIGDTLVRVKAGQVIERDKDTVTYFVRFPYLDPKKTSRTEYVLYVNLFPVKKIFKQDKSTDSSIFMLDSLGMPVPMPMDSSGIIRFWPSQPKNLEKSEWEIGEATKFGLVTTFAHGEENDTLGAPEFVDVACTFSVAKKQFDDGEFDIRILAIINGTKHWAKDRVFLK